MQPFPGYALMPSLVAPSPGDVIISYEIVQPRPGCCACGSLSLEGLVLVIILAFVFWPATFVICCMTSMHVPKQRPVYGSMMYPIAGLAQGMPVTSSPAPKHVWPAGAPGAKQF